MASFLASPRKNSALGNRVIVYKPGKAFLTQADSSEHLLRRKAGARGRESSGKLNWPAWAFLRAAFMLGLLEHKGPELLGVEVEVGIHFVYFLLLVFLLLFVFVCSSPSLLG